MVFLFPGSSAAAFKFPRELASREFMEKLLTLAPEDTEPLFILLAVTEGDKATFEVFKGDADPCGEEPNLEGWDTALGCPFISSNFISPKASGKSILVILFHLEFHLQ